MIYGARREKLFKGNALREPKPTRYSRRIFAYHVRAPSKCQPIARNQNVCSKTISTNNRNAYRAARYRRDTRNLINRRTGSPHRPIIRKTFRSRLHISVWKNSRLRIAADTCTILKSLSNIVLCIKS